MQILMKKRIKQEFTMGFNILFKDSSSDNADRMLLIGLVDLNQER